MVLTNEERYKLDNEVRTILAILQEDLDELTINLKQASFPILITVCSGIDFCGGLIEGFSSKSRIRFVNFFIKYINDNQKLAHYVYSFIRNKISHGAYIHGKFETSKTHEEHWHFKHKIEYLKKEKSNYPSLEGIQTFGSPASEAPLETIVIQPDAFKRQFIDGLSKFDIEYSKGLTFKDQVLINFKIEKDKAINDSRNMIEDCNLEQILVDRIEHIVNVGTSVQTLYTLSERKLKN